MPSTPHALSRPTDALPSRPPESGPHRTREGHVGVIDGLRFASHFQPIYSLTHGRAVGHEALLRASDASGRPVPPLEVFRVDDAEALVQRDVLAGMVHLSNFAAQAAAVGWLFLNVHPRLLELPGGDGLQALLGHVEGQLGLSPQRLVLEMLETGVGDDARLEEAVRLARHRGCLVALDDFGAGHSNFDRVWRLRPEIVKLDRSLVARAAVDRGVRRMLAQIVSLLHECGALVLLEGVETLDEATVALEADADMVQGWWFGRPAASLVHPEQVPDGLQSLWPHFEAQRRVEQHAARAAVDPYLAAIREAGEALQAGQRVPLACAGFLGLPNAELCYLLAADGTQIGTNVWSRELPALGVRNAAYEPLRDTRHARWSRRPYFRRACQSPGVPQVTRPYRTLHGGHLSVTVSYGFTGPDGALRVLCGDLRWSPVSEHG